MKKISRTNLISIIIFAIMAVVLSTSLFGCQVLSRFTGGSSTATTETGTSTYIVNKGTITQSISATGTVGSSETKNLSVQISGEVLQSTSAGTQVKKGDVLLKIDNTDLLNSIKQAQINIEVAEASLKNTQISYQAALDANHIAVQTAQLDIQSSQQSVDAAAVSADNSAASADNTERTGNSSIESAQLALEKAQDNFNFSIAQAQISLNQAADKLNSNSGDSASSYSYQSAYLSRDSAVASATNSLESATAALSASDAQAQANNENAGNSYEQALISYNQALISQSKIYWSTLSSLQKAKATIQSTVLSISTSQKQVELAKISLDNTSKNLDKDVITAPFDGVILTATYNKGDYISENPTAISIASTDFLVESSVAEADISKVAVGNTATIVFDAYPDKTFQGEIASISGAPTVSNNITSYAIKVKLTDISDLKLFYGLTTDLTVVTAEAKDVLMVPVQAVYTENGKQYVDVLVSDQADTGQTGDTSTESTAPSGTPPNGSAPSGSKPTGTFPSRSQGSTDVQANQKTTEATTTKKVEITTGITDYTYYEVTSGLKEGDIVITSAE